MSEQPVLFCHRCGRELVPGKGDWFVVKIEAMADPTPPVITEEDLSGDLEAEMRKVIGEIEEEMPTQREAMDDVYRRLVLHLCRRCYKGWIEKPV